MAAFVAILGRDLRLGLRSGVDSAQPLIFFVIALTLFPLGVGPAPEILERIGVGVIWVLALLAVMLSLDRLFQADAEDGSLEQLALADLPLELTVLAKCLAHWLMSGLVLVIASPLLALLLHQSAETISVLALALLLGTPVLTLIGSIGAALLIGARRGGVLIALLVLPLYIPILIFGVSAVEAEVMGLGGSAQLLILGATLLAALALAPFAAAAALRLSME
ncbi:MAG: heme exporter protein CcmB [Alphaproteobacteria bacterium]|nr:heme exporter protein CcmB [Alphaproteobacteria bacterium]